MADLLKYQAICEIIPDMGARLHATGLDRDETLSLVRHPDDEVNPNAVAVYHKKIPIAWIPIDILDDLAACLDKGLVADASLMRVDLDEEGVARAIEVLIFLEPPETKEPKPAPKRRLGTDEKDRSDLVASAWVGLGAIVVVGLVLLFLYWMLVRPALEKTAPVEQTSQAAQSVPTPRDPPTV